MFANNIKIAKYIFLTLVFFQLQTTAARSLAKDCDFSNLVQELPFISEHTTDVTEKLRNDSSTWQQIEYILPNVKRVFASKEPPFYVLLGWAESWENFEKHTREEVKAHLSTYMEIGAARLQKQGGIRSHYYSPDDPLTIYVTNVPQEDGGTMLKEIAIDVVAAPNCIFSMKISAKADELEENHWIEFKNQIEIARKIIKQKHGLVQFSISESKTWWSFPVEQLIWIALIFGVAFSISRIYLKRFTLTPSSTTRNYSVFLMVLATIIVASTIWAGLVLGPTISSRYEYVPHFVIIFLVHLWAFISNKPKIVSFALWFIAVGLAASVMSWIIGWSTFTVGNVIGVGIGASVVAYTIVKSSSQPKEIETLQDKKSSMILICSGCNFSINFNDFKNDRLFCPECGSRLNIETQ